MNASRNWLVALILLGSSGCGQQLVQFGDTEMASPTDAARDLSTADLIPTPDAAVQLDMTVADLAMPDLFLADLRLPDLQLPDLQLPDLQLPDLQLPDLQLRPDLMMVDLMPDLLAVDLLGIDLLNQGTGPLASLETYALLASSTITNTGASTIIGNVGLNPGAAISGIPPGMPINGAIHIDDGPAMQAQMDLTFAYNFMAAKPCGTNLTGMDLGGMTLAPGVYCFNISAAMAIGTTLILDSQGDPNASWTFQIASTLILGDFAKIHVINGGRDCSVYWQVGSSATLGIGARLAGSLLAQASITMVKGASVGRALARTGGVTMDTNDVAVGPCR